MLKKKIFFCILERFFKNKMHYNCWLNLYTQASQIKCMEFNRQYICKKIYLILKSLNLDAFLFFI